MIEEKIRNLIKEIQKEIRLGDKRAEQFYNSLFSGESIPIFAQLGLIDTGGDHELYLKCNENLSADRILYLILGDSTRTITLSGNPTLDNWFDQNVKQAASPTFASMILDTATNPGILYKESNTDRGKVQYGTAANALLYQTVNASSALTTRFRIEGEIDDTRISVGASAGLAGCDLSLLVNGILGLKETTTPTATTNYGKIYTKNDNKLYFQDGAGVEHEIAYAP